MKSPSLSELQSEIADFLRSFPEILFAILYGSAVEGESYRDLDIALWVDRAQLLPEQDLDFEFRVESELRRRLRFPVDVRIVNEAPLSFRYHVSIGVPLWVRDEEAYSTFRERTWDEYFDFQPIALAYLREMRDG
ncbi:MAG: nucleotidyltransferase domain-containing protein [Anaerolineales bacterium]|nr:nucleotidyltransferase domain-containing protein [Anaerolineales bacterium]MDW8445896.1 nucleotidyltransferase domain-containing protein [Anaerolineales bacterium]